MSDSEADAFEQQRLRELAQEVEGRLRLPDVQEFEDQQEVAMVMAEPLRKPAAKTLGSRKQGPGVRVKRSADDARCPPLAAFVGRPWAECVAADLPVKSSQIQLWLSTWSVGVRSSSARQTLSLSLRKRAAKENAAAVLQKRTAGRSNWGGLNSKRAG